MIIIVYSETTEQSLEARLGMAEYSYYFVLKEFLPALEELGQVVVVEIPEKEVDPIFHDATRRGEACIFLSFSPPHRTALGLACPTIPVFAWEFDSISSETWYCEREQDWRFVLNRLGRAITHSAHTVGAVRSQMGPDFPVVSIPAPVWDRFAPHYRSRRNGKAPAGASLSVVGRVIDTRESESIDADKTDADTRTDIAIEGVVYLSIFNPKDGRKNVFDMIGAFCEAFRDVEDATLILKLTHHTPNKAIFFLQDILQRLMPYKCRILLLTGYLRSEMYETLVAASSYAVNTSFGEGQCLPLMEPMACGSPAVAPDHTGMADYIDAENAFIVESSAEPAAMPQDPRYAFRVLRRRIDFESLVKAYRDSYRVAIDDPERYARMSRNAHETLRRHCSRAAAVERLSKFLEQPWRAAESNADFGRIKPRSDAPWMDAISSRTRVLEYGAKVSRIALLYARLGAKVDAVGRTESFCESVNVLARRYQLDLQPHIGELGANPAGTPRAYDLISLDGEFLAQAPTKLDVASLHDVISPHGKIVVSNVPPRAPEKSLLGGLGNRMGSRSPLGEIVRRFGNAGFTWKQDYLDFNDPLEPVYEFSAWTDPLQLADHSLTPEEQACWHGIEPHGRWTKAHAFLEIPSRDGQIEIAVQNHRRSRCIGRMTFGARTVKFALSPGESRKILFRQSQSQARKRLEISSNTDRGGPNNSRMLGLYVVSIRPI